MEDFLEEVPIMVKSEVCVGLSQVKRQGSCLSLKEEHRERLAV